MPVDGPVWDDGTWRGLPPLGGATRADVCVVGLGGSGLTAVLELLDRGVSVVGMDAGPVGAGAAGRNGGFLLAGLARPHHEVVAQVGRERAVALYRAT
ncbi:MAG: FAD-dependent oxidoreductase, partial [Nocardioides sp.]